MSGVDRPIECGETYDHAEHGRVEVIELWNGIERLDSTRTATETDASIVRYATEPGGIRDDERIETYAEFLAAIE